MCVALAAQQSPYHIKNYKPGEYGGFNQTWQVQQDQNGLIYVASTSEIFAYDGVMWNHIPVKRGAAIRQILFDTTSQTMYVGSVQEFGYLGRDSAGYPVYHSFMDQLKADESVFTDVWKIQQQGNRIYFQSAEHIFIVEGRKIIGRIDPAPGNTFALMFNCGGRLFVRQRNVGLMEVEGIQMHFVPNSEMFATVKLMGMLQMDAQTNYLLTSDQGFVRMDHANTSQPSFGIFRLQSDPFLMTSNVIGTEWINENEFAVYGRYGMRIYNRNFAPLTFFTKSSGLNDECISEIFVDREKNIWLAMNNGCATISYSAPAMMYNEDYGYDGSLEIMNISGDTMYLGGSTGVFRSVSGTPPDFQRVDGIPNEAWDIMSTHQHTIVSSSTGVYDVHGNVTSKLNDHYCNSAAWIDSNRTMVVAEKGGFSVLSVTGNGQWQTDRYFRMPGVELIRISEPQSTDKANEFTFYAMTRFKTCVIATFNAVDSALHYREYGPKNGLTSEDYFPVKIGDSVFLFNPAFAFRYVSADDVNDSAVCFYRAPDIYQRIYQENIQGIRGPVNPRLFIENHVGPYTKFFGRIGGTLLLKPVLLGKLFQGINIQSACLQDTSTLWILGQQVLVKYNLNYRFDSLVPFDALITRVRFHGDTEGLFLPAYDLTVAYENNSVIFNFAAPYFKYNMSSVFRYQLLGYDTAWSKPSRDAEKEYTNLPEGTYTFVVQAKNPFNRDSREARFTFTVLPPWYRTMWAYFIYTIGFILFVFASIRISARRLRRQKEKLEVIVTERTAEVVAQKQQIEKQKVDLESAYTGIQDSIHYSQRIQHAILPTDEQIRRIVPDSFVLFYPRDIVSGDFYWFAEQNGTKYIACVDCTGHGVPGALMSMVGNTILNQIILERHVSLPDEVLDQLHIGVRQALKQDIGGDTRDGMDIALIAIAPDQKSLRYAGANRSLWIVRDGILLETKADKFPIAGVQQEEERRFTLHTVSLQQGDCVYLTTDGYADQFGGPRGKKFMVKRLTGILTSMHDVTMSQQKAALEHHFNSWRGAHEQVDDVLVIGVRISNQ